MDPYEREIERLRQLYEEVETDNEEVENMSESDDDSIADENFVLERDHATDTEQEATDEESEEGESVSEESRSAYYYGKDGTKWRKEAPPLNVRTRSRNIITHLPGVTGVARNASTTVQCFMLFFDDILPIIIENTNIFIRANAHKYANKYDTKDTDECEIKALLGLLYLAGSQHGGRKNLLEFYGTDGLGAEIFPATMAFRRVRFLLRCLRFDDINTRKERKALDKLAPVRSMVEVFNQKCKANYSPGQYITLDEMLLAFRGRCSFKMYIPNKPDKYGLKVFSTVDARTFYTTHLEIYAGTQPDGPFKIENSTGAVTERMCLHLSGTRRNITMDRWFTGFQIVKRLLEVHQLTVVGTIQSNRRELPHQITNIKNRSRRSSVFAFSTDMTAVSYVPKKSKNVLLLSSMILDNKIDEATGEEAKPEIITFYNLTKGGVDVVDRKISSYNVARNTRRWPMVVFYGLMNVAAVNAFEIYKKKKQSRRRI